MEMEYEKFIKRWKDIWDNNYDILRDGCNSCDVCFDYNIQLRELLGVMLNNMSSSDGTRDYKKSHMNYFDLHYMLIILKPRNKKGICSHLSEALDITNLKKTKMYNLAKREMDDKK